MAIVFRKLERVAYEEDRLREARYWATRSIAERVIAGWELAEDDFRLKDADESEKRTGITLRRVARSWR